MKLPVNIPKLDDLFSDSSNSDKKQKVVSRLYELLSTDIGKDREKEYLHWDRLKYKELPEQVENHEEWWYLIKFRRSNGYRKLPFCSKDGSQFVYWIPDRLQQLLHVVDQQASGRVQIAAEVTNPATRDRYLVSSLIEEAITSSQLEGASTTNKVAKEMLRDRRRPKDKSERMIFNNYRAMSFIREVVDQPLSKNLLLELHRVVTDGTLDDSSAVGRFRTSKEEVAIYDERDNTLLHEPPHADELERRIGTLIDFANSSEKHVEFLHPVIRSILLHFMIGYDHPFVDGNGRTARALFYWSMAKHGYWVMEHISISTILKKGPAKYARSFLFTESDGNDTTYFLDFNLSVIIRAIKGLQQYLARKANEIKQVEQMLGSSFFTKNLNYRQLAIISYALRHPNGTFSIEGHRASHNISYPTARSDLLELVNYELLDKRKIGNAFIFTPVEEMQEKLSQLKETFR